MRGRRWQPPRQRRSRDDPMRERGNLMRGDDSLAAILLVSRLCAKGLKPLKASEFWALRDLTGNGHPRTGSEDVGLGALLGRDEEQLVNEWGLSADLAGRVAGLLGRATAVAFELEQLQQSGIKTITVFDEHYPQRWLTRLASKAPAVLHAVGAVEKFETPGVGVVGSRNVSQAGAAVAERVARCAAGLGLPVVSGGARGVDQIAMNAAFESAGSVVGILADSLTRKVKRRDVREAVYTGSVLICTPYGPNAPFNVGNAMGRNKLVYAQAALTVVVASDHGSGGTWAGATEALKHRYGRVAVWRGDGEGPGNEALQQRGAEPITDLDDMRTLIRQARSPHSQPDPAPNPRPELSATQLSLV